PTGVNNCSLSFTGTLCSRGPSFVVRSVSSVGSNIIPLNGIPAWLMRPQPICTRLLLGMFVNVWAAYIAPAVYWCLPDSGVNTLPSNVPSMYVPEAPYITHFVLLGSPSMGSSNSSGHSQNPVVWLS